jgi:hypothetical protein
MALCPCLVIDNLDVVFVPLDDEVFFCYLAVDRFFVSFHYQVCMCHMSLLSVLRWLLRSCHVDV